jgi:hypothetical protein
LFQLVKDADFKALGNAFPRLGENDYLLKETINEREAAMVIVNRVMDTESLTWEKINNKLTHRLYGNWSDPGRVLDMTYLSNNS